MRALICGASGQDGSYLAALLLCLSTMLHLELPQARARMWLP